MCCSRSRSDPDYGKLSRPLARRDDRRRAGRGRALQERPRRFRAVEAVAARPAGLGQPVGPRPAGLAHRMLGDERGASRRDASTSTAAASTSSSRITRTRSRRARARMAASRSRATGCITASSPSTARRWRSRWAISAPSATCWTRRRARRRATRMLMSALPRSARLDERPAEQAKHALDRFYLALRDAPTTPAPAALPGNRVRAALDDDLNTPLALAALHELLGRAQQGDRRRATRRGSRASCWPAARCWACCSRTPRPGSRAPIDEAAEIEALIAAAQRRAQSQELRRGRPHPHRAGDPRHPSRGRARRHDRWRRAV